MGVDMLGIPVEKVCDFIVRVREFDAKEGVVEDEPAANMADDDFREDLADFPDDPVQQELREFLESLNEEEMENMLALVWLGRGDFVAKEWDQALAEAAQVRDAKAPDYLLGMPLVSDYLEEGLSLLDYSCAD